MIVRTKSLQRISSSLLEKFLPYTLNKAEREEDSSKVKTFGPFAYALGHLTEWGGVVYRKRCIDI